MWLLPGERPGCILHVTGPPRSINKETAEPDSSSRKIRQILKCQQHSSMVSIRDSEVEGVSHPG